MFSGEGFQTIGAIAGVAALGWCVVRAWRDRPALLAKKVIRLLEQSTGRSHD